MTANNTNANARNTNANDKLDSVEALQSAGFIKLENFKPNEVHSADYIVTHNGGLMRSTNQKRKAPFAGVQQADALYTAYKATGDKKHTWKDFQADVQWHAFERRRGAPPVAGIAQQRNKDTYALDVFFSTEARARYDKANAKTETKAD